MTDITHISAKYKLLLILDLMNIPLSVSAITVSSNPEEHKDWDGDRLESSSGTSVASSTANKTVMVTGITPVKIMPQCKHYICIMIRSKHNNQNLSFIL